MSKPVKIIGIVLGSLIGLLLVTPGALYAKTTLQFRKTYNIPVKAISIPTNPEAIARGKQWVESQCTHCHGLDLSGELFLDDPALATMYAPNLTPGEGGTGAKFTDLDWVRALRHGIHPDGRSLVIMPSVEYTHFSDADLGDIIAYLKSLPGVNMTQPKAIFRPVGRILVAAGAFGPIIQAEAIDHTAERPTTILAGVSLEYGKYVVDVSGCRTCHGPDLTGAQSPEPGSPFAPGLIQGSQVAYWSEADFIQTMRSGVVPSGREMSDFMPWKDFRKMSDEQLKAIFLYLGSVPGD